MKTVTFTIPGTDSTVVISGQDLEYMVSLVEAWREQEILKTPNLAVDYQKEIEDSLKIPLWGE